MQELKKFYSIKLDALDKVQEIQKVKQEKGESIQRYELRLSTKAKELEVPTENNSVISSAFLAGLENNKVREGIIDRKELNAPLKE